MQRQLAHNHLLPAALVNLVLVALSPSIARAQIDVSLTQVGDPIWRPSEVHVFTAPADSDETFLAVLDSIRPGGPFVQEDPPYDTVVGDGMAAAGYVDASLYTTTAINGQNGSYFTFTLVPDPGVTGSSFHFESGPVIPKNLLPLQTYFALRREGVVIDDNFWTTLEGPPELLENVDGAAYIRPFFETDAVFFPAGTELLGNWEWTGTLRDPDGNGWDIAVPFQVVPEPSAAALCLVSALALLMFTGREPRSARVTCPQ